MRLLALLLPFFIAAQPVYAVSAAGQAPAKPRLTIAADEWCPINCGPGDERPGIGIELAKAAFEPLGYEIDYRIMPWSQALEEVRSGKVDAVVGASRADEASLVFPASALLRISDDFYVQAGNPWRYQGPASLAKLRIGVIEDYGYGEVVSAAIREKQKQMGAVHAAGGKTALQDNLNKLAARKIDVLVESRAVMEYSLAKLGLEDQVQWAGAATKGQEVYLAFSPAIAASKTRAAQYDAAMAQWRAAGRMEAVYRTYGLRP